MKLTVRLILISFLALGVSCKKRTIHRGYLANSNKKADSVKKEDSETTAENLKGEKVTTEQSSIDQLSYLTQALKDLFLENNLEELKRVYKLKSVKFLDTYLNQSLDSDSTPLSANDLSDEEFDQLLSEVSTLNLNNYLNDLVLSITSYISDNLETINISVTENNKITINSFKLKDREVQEDLLETAVNAKELTNNDKAEIIARLASGALVYPREDKVIESLETINHQVSDTKISLEDKVLENETKVEEKADESVMALEQNHLSSNLLDIPMRDLEVKGLKTITFEDEKEITELPKNSLETYIMKMPHNPIELGDSLTPSL